MTRVLLLPSFAALLLPLATPATNPAKSPKERGREIAVMVDRAAAGFGSEINTVEMKLINAHGDVIVRRMRSSILEGHDDGDKSVITFEWPADVKGTRMLTWTHKARDDDQWLYLPAIKRVKRISSQNKTGSFMGSEFSYEDLAGQEVEKFTYNYLADDTAGGQALWKIERFPVDPNSGYSKQIVWVDQVHKTLGKIDYHDRKGELLKTAVFSDYAQYNAIWRVGKIVMRNHQTHKRSELTFAQRELGQPIDEDIFDSDNLDE